MMNTHTFISKKCSYFIAFIFVLAMHPLAYAQIASDSIGCVPLLVKFTSPVSTLDKPFWDFGDGASSNKLNPTHVFVLPGKYTATLSNNGTIIAKTNITIYNEVDVLINYDPQIGCAPMSVQFKNQSKVDTGITIVSYLWDFGDGNSANVADPIYTYTSIGQFSPTLNIKTNIAQCDATKSFKDAINITQNLNINFVIDSISPKCDVPATVYVRPIGQLDSSYAYKWNFGNDSISDVLYPGSMTYLKQGQYNIVFSIDNKKGCKSSISKSILVGNEFPKFKIIAPEKFCLKADIPISCSIQFPKYLWTFDSGASMATSDVIAPMKLNYSTTGMHIIKLTVFNSLGCSKDTTFTINIEELENDILFEPKVVCGQSDTIMLSAKNKNYTIYRWNGMIGGPEYKYIITEVKRDSFYYNYPDSVVIKLESINTGACVTEDKAVINLQKPNAQFSLTDFQGIAPFTVYVKDLSESPCPIVTWIYTWGDGTTSVYDAITIKTASHTYNNPGKYYINLKIINEKGCEDPYYGAWVKVGKVPQFDTNNGMCTLSGGKAGYNFCFGDTITIIGNLLSEDITAIRYNLDNTIGHCETEQVVTHILNDAPGKYTFGFTAEGFGVFYDRLVTNINVYGAKAVMDYEVMCNALNTVKFEDKSIDATSSFWVIDGDTIREKKFDINFAIGKHDIKLCAQNDNVECRPHCVVDSIDIKDLKAIIDTNPEWCANAENLLSGLPSKDVSVGCHSGYTWLFPSVSDRPPLQTAKDSTFIKLPSGEQDIILVVKDINGCRDTASTTVHVYDLKAKFTSNLSALCIPAKMQFMDMSTSDTTLAKFTWSFDPSKNIPKIDFVFDTLLVKDSMAIFLQVTDVLGCVDVYKKFYKIYKPTTTVTYPTKLCEVRDVNFKATDFTTYGSSLKYKWELSNNVVSETDVCKIKNLSPGNYKMHLTIEEKASGCINSDYDFPFTIIKKPEAKIKELTDSIFCYPESIVFTSDSSTYDLLDAPTFVWNFGNNRTSFKRNPIETFGKGKFHVSLILYSAYQCSDTAYTDIRLIGPEGKIKADKDTICLNEEVTYTLSNKVDVSNFYWDFGQGETNTGVNPAKYKYQFLPPSGKTYASVILESLEKGCETVLTVPIRFHKTEALFGGDSTCENTMVLDNQSVGADKYEWYNDKKLLSNDKAYTFTPPTTGKYNIHLVVKNNENLCIDTFSRQLSFLEKPVIHLGDQSLCEDQTFLLPVDNKIATYQFSPSNVATLKDNAYIITPAGIQQLNIKLIGKNGCEAEKEIGIDYRTTTKIDTTIILALCPSGTTIVPFDFTKNDTVRWFYNGGDASTLLDCVNCSNPTLTNPENGILSANISDFDQCRSEKYNFQLTPLDAQMPNVFSPNHDETNDTFKAVVRNKALEPLMKIKELKIFNRWGKEIYNNNIPWNGMIDGQPATEDIYYFLITYSVQDNCDIFYKGDLTLIR